MSVNSWGVALGNFDGVHLGHRALLARLLEKEEDLTIKTMVFTFRQHPQNVLIAGNKVPFIYPPEKKKSVIEDLGIDRVEMVDFTPEFSKMEPERFFKEFLLNCYNIKYLVVGFNYRFGKGGKGDTELLKKIGKDNGFQVDVVVPVRIDGKIISSSLIRNLLSFGNIKTANKCLGRNYSIKCKVLKGHGRGRKIGFPTANICMPEGVLYPAIGVYITITRCKGIKYHSITNVGMNPTFMGNKLVIETYIPGFDSNIYSEEIEVEFLERIRKEKKFENKEDLILVYN